MTKASFLKFYTDMPHAEQAYDAILHELIEQGVYSPNMLIGALATVRVEVGRNFLPVRERITEVMANRNYGGKYGNTEPGDGYKYRGSGFIQLTFKANYNQFKTTPEKLLEVPESARVLVAFLKARNCKRDADNNDWLSFRKKVNGFNRVTKLPNGWLKFKKVVKAYQDAL